MANQRKSGDLLVLNLSIDEAYSPGQILQSELRLETLLTDER